MKKIIGIMSIVVSIFLLMNSKTNREVASVKTKMEYVEICKKENECKLFSRLVMGTDHLIQGGWVNNQWPKYSIERAEKVLDKARSLGINFFDTSPIYVGSVENVLGDWLEKNKWSGPNPDNKLYVLSKGGFPLDLYWISSLPKTDPLNMGEQLTQEYQLKGSHSQDFIDYLIRSGEDLTYNNNQLFFDKRTPPGTYVSRLYGSKDQIVERIENEISHTEDNLHNNITMYLMHRDDFDFYKFKEFQREYTEVETIMDALSSKRLREKYWMIGWSNWRTPRVDESIQIAKNNQNLNKLIINSPYFSLFEMSDRSIHAGGIQVTHSEMMDENFQKGIKIMPYSPLGGFSILDKPGNTPNEVWENAKKDARVKYENGDAYWMNVFHAIFTVENEKRYYRVVKFTKEFNLKHETNYTIDQMINAYALAHPRTDFLAVGPITEEQLNRTVDSIELSKYLTDRDLDYLHSGVK